MKSSKATPTQDNTTYDIDQSYTKVPMATHTQEEFALKVTSDLKIQEATCQMNAPKATRQSKTNKANLTQGNSHPNKLVPKTTGQIKHFQDNSRTKELVL